MTVRELRRLKVLRDVDRGGVGARSRRTSKPEIYGVIRAMLVAISAVRGGMATGELTRLEPVYARVFL